LFCRILLTLLLLAFLAVDASAAVPASSINLGVQASTADLATIINQSLPKDLYKGQGVLGTSVTVLRTGPVAVTAADNYVYLAVPVQLTFKYALYESSPLRATLRFKAKVDVTPDWRLKTELYYTGLSDNLADTFKIGPVSLKPKSAVDNISQPVQRLLAPIIDRKINDAVQLQAKVAPLWQSAFAPKLVSKEFSAWLKLTPERIVMSPLLAARNQIQLSIGVITGAEITVGPQPVAVPAKALPPVQQLPSFDKAFHVHLPTEIFFADLVTALNPVLVDKTFGEDKKITVKHVNVKGADGRLVVVLDVTGAIDGEITVLAKPVCNPQSNSVTFEDVDFDTRHTGLLVTAGSWLFSSKIQSTIKSKLDTAVVEQLEKAKGKASSALSSVQLSEHVKLSGAVKSLSVGQTAVHNDHLFVHVTAEGDSTVSLK
jgi:hypothetical protein